MINNVDFNGKMWINYLNTLIDGYSEEKKNTNLIYLRVRIHWHYVMSKTYTKCVVGPIQSFGYHYSLTYIEIKNTHVTKPIPDYSSYVGRCVCLYIYIYIYMHPLIRLQFVVAVDVIKWLAPPKSLCLWC